jgi:uncharacterized DUF497 family protein
VVSVSFLFMFLTMVRSDVRYSKTEKRYYALGQTGAGRRLFSLFDPA